MRRDAPGAARRPAGVRGPSPRSTVAPGPYGTRPYGTPHDGPARTHPPPARSTTAAPARGAGGGSGMGRISRC
ncbi:hypothetical protein ACWF94_39235, partial [Streptomyces sp. NPDC055078]